MVIKETNIWGNYHNIRNMNERIRLMKKLQVLQRYPFIDHCKIYAYKPKTQRGPAKEDQTFIVSYAYNYDAFADEAKFISELNDIGLLFFKEKCLYNDKDAYKIIVCESSCPMDVLRERLIQ